MAQMIKEETHIDDVWKAFLTFLNEVLSRGHIRQLPDSYTGLCYNWDMWGYSSYSNITGNYSLKRYIRLKLINDGLDDYYPFDDNRENYFEATQQNSHFTNPRRLKWIAEKLLACGIKPSFKYIDDLSSSTEPDKNVAP